MQLLASGNPLMSIREEEMEVTKGGLEGMDIRDE
jgi:hypothetical protein